MKPSSSESLPPLAADTDDDQALDDAANALGLSLPAEGDDWSNISEITAETWRDHPDIVTDSLWFIGSRSREGVHTSEYHGNFVPQIPYQAIRRFTKPGDVVLDTFLGSGTTLIESRRLGRNGLGIELSKSIAQASAQRIEAEANPYDTWQTIIYGDSTQADTIAEVRKRLAVHNRDRVEMIIMHPPYHDIIRFSDHPQDLSNALTVSDFIDAFKTIVYRTYDLLAQDHFLVVVIGDKYSDRAWVPLGFKTMEAVQSVGYRLKSIVVKNMEGNRAKRNLGNFWRRRAFKGDFYIFKHEYVFFFQKTTALVDELQTVKAHVARLDAREELGLIQANTFASGDALSQQRTRSYAAISSARVLVMKQGNRIRAVVINLNGIVATQAVIAEVQAFLASLPDSVLDVALIAGFAEKETWILTPGVSQVYTPTNQSLQQLAHTLYVLRKAAGSGQRVRLPEGVALASEINHVFETTFTVDKNYIWQQGDRDLNFKFFVDGEDQGVPNVEIGIKSTWVGGYEREKATQIRERHYQKGYTLIAVVGHRAQQWSRLIETQGNFADYYLILSKADRKSLAQALQNRPLVRAVGDTGVQIEEQSLVAWLQMQIMD